MPKRSFASITFLVWIRNLYFLEKASTAGSSMSFEELNNVMDTSRATLYRHVQTLVDKGLISKEKDPTDGRRNIISVTIPVRILRFNI